MKTSSIGGSAAHAYLWRVPPSPAFPNLTTLPDGVNRKLAQGLPSCLSLAGIATCTYLSFHFDQSFAFTGFLHLVFVVLAAMYGGFWQATLISAVAAGCLNYFFVPPIFSFVNSPANWVALGSFEFTALIISRLSRRAQQRATEAIAERRDMQRLYETSQRILLLEPSSEPANLIPPLILDIFKLSGVQLFDGVSGIAHQGGASEARGEQRIQEAYSFGEDSFEVTTRSWYCVLRSRSRPVGGLALHGTEMSRLAATALASLCGIALERARALQRESHAHAVRETEQLRTAVLDALAHQFKTPLTVARTASSGLLAVGGLSELQNELVTVLDQQAKKLDHLASRLLGAARLDSKEFKPRREPLLFSYLVEAALKRLDQATDRDRFRVWPPDRELPVLADRELILTSLAQLVDNAIQYSEPESPIDIKFAVTDTEVVLIIRSKGLVVGPADRERVFERFYRAPETQHLPAGTGLGLSIVRKIVEAHHGWVSAAGEAGYGTSFSISLPASGTR